MGRSRSRNRTLRSPRNKRSRSRHSRGRRSDSRERSHRRAGHKRDRRYSRSRNDRSRSSSERRSPPVFPRSFRESWDTLVSRLNVLEGRSSLIGVTTAAAPCTATSQAADESTVKIVEAIQSLKSVSNPNYYVSNFDPNFHDVDAWFSEVDRAQGMNRWSDYECLSRVGNCLKGDAKAWLNEWVSDDRSWSNFKKDFKPLCIHKVDVASILYDVMSTDSDNYLTYAEYTRRTLLRLRIVKGLSDDLITAIVIRGIKDPQVKASASNAKLMPNDRR